jgi:hypothetical protein
MVDRITHRLRSSDLLSKFPVYKKSQTDEDDFSVYALEERDYSDIINLKFSEGRYLFPSGISCFQNLQHLYLYANGFDRVPSEIRYLKNLVVFDISHNVITSIPPWVNELLTLTFIDFSYNCLKDLPPLNRLTNLQHLAIHNNSFNFFPETISSLTSLLSLECQSNKIEVVPSWIKNLNRLESFYITGNELTSLPSELCYLTRLVNIGYSRNPIEYIPPQVVRFLERIRLCEEIYTDSQSVHNSSVQQTFRETVFRLANKKPELDEDETIKEVLRSSLLNDSKKHIVKYCSSNDIHSGINMTYKELLMLVWDRIRKSKDMKEILSVLDTEITDSKSMCFTGRITRLVNCLNGFDTDVIINISDNEQISNLMVLINKKYAEKEDKKQEFTKAMKERGFSQEKIDEWVEYF